MNKVISADGTHIAFDRTSQGPAVIVVPSALADRSDAAKLAGLLAERFTVIDYDRRGRGDSGDTKPYAVERDIEDLTPSLRRPVGRRPCSELLRLGPRPAGSGKRAQHQEARRVRAAVPSRRRIPARTIPDPARAAAGRGSARPRRQVLHANRHGRSCHSPRPDPLAARNLGEADGDGPTLPYEYAVMGDTLSGRPLSAQPWAGVTIPTLVMEGTKSPARLHSAAAALTGVLPNAQRRTLADQDHSTVVRSPGARWPRYWWSSSTPDQQRIVGRGRGAETARRWRKHDKAALESNRWVIALLHRIEAAPSSTSVSTLAIPIRVVAPARRFRHG
jgi:hypothetical protein